MKVEIKVIRDGMPEELHTFHDDHLLIGRLGKNDLNINDPSVSKSHLEVFFQGDRIKVHDLKSRNGIIFKDEIVEHVVLENQGEIRIGDVRLQFHFDNQNEKTRDIDLSSFLDRRNTLKYGAIYFLVCLLDVIFRFYSSNYRKPAYHVFLEILRLILETGSAIIFFSICFKLFFKKYHIRKVFEILIRYRFYLVIYLAGFAWISRSLNWFKYVNLVVLIMIFFIFIYELLKTAMPHQKMKNIIAGMVGFSLIIFSLVKIPLYIKERSEVYHKEYKFDASLGITTVYLARPREMTDSALDLVESIEKIKKDRELILAKLKSQRE